jgi:hypothetical protein
MTKHQESQALALQVHLFIAKGGKVKRLPAGRGFRLERDSFTNGIDTYHIRAILRAARGV